MTIRIAKPEDRQEVWRLLLQSHAENGLFRLYPPKVDYLLDRVLYPHLIPAGDAGPRGEIAIIGDVGELEAMCFVLLGSMWYSDEYHIEELIIYVSPEHRKSTHAKDLISWMKTACDITGLKVLTGVMSNHRTEAKVRLYERQLPKIGAFFLYPTDTKTLQ